MVFLFRLDYFDCPQSFQINCCILVCFQFSNNLFLRFSVQLCRPLPSIKARWPKATHVLTTKMNFHRLTSTWKVDVSVSRIYGGVAGGNTSRQHCWWSWEAEGRLVRRTNSTEATSVGRRKQAFRGEASDASWLRLIFYASKTAPPTSAKQSREEELSLEQKK